MLTRENTDMGSILTPTQSSGDAGSIPIEVHKTEDSGLIPVYNNDYINFTLYYPVKCSLHFVQNVYIPFQEIKIIYFIFNM